MVRLLVIWVIALSMLACNETEETPPGGVAVEENTETVVGNNAGDVLPAVAVAGATVEVPAAVTAAVETARAKAEQAEAEEVAAEEAEEQVAAAARFVAGRDSGGTKSAGVVVETDEQGRVQLNADSFKVNAPGGAGTGELQIKLPGRGVGAMGAGAKGGAGIRPGEPRTCVAGGCKVICPAQQPCNATCAGGNCRYVCGEGGACDFSCSGGGCTQICNQGAICTLSCDGGGCIRDCNGGTTCTRSCSGGGCEG